MAIVTTVNSSLVGVREQLLDLISTISPTDTPFSMMCGKGSAENTLVEWQMDALDAAVATNKQPDGATAPDNTFVATTRPNNRTQILAKTVQVSGTANATNKAGRSNKEMAYQLIKKTKEIKRDLESSLMQNTTAIAGTGATAGQLRGLEGWIGANQVVGATQQIGVGGVAPNPMTNTAPTDGTQRALSLAQIKDAVQQCYTTGGTPDTLMFGVAQRVAFSALAGSATRYVSADEKALIESITVLDTDFGPLKVQPNRFQRNRTAFVLESGDFDLMYLRPLAPKELAVTGDFEAKELVMEVTLKVENYNKHSAVRDLT